ncbi:MULTISPECIES: sirohydrochlorin cobaltochelatase [Segatella]|uniref:Sirohydrochlorin cobaltochelatase n=1 Tax=Segatella baroniae B14 TaxID=752555 RepID=D8DUG4_9BACT|nr:MULTISPECIES: sirohydrochlorin cobaltochelatase [Segatella]EFI72939.1 hypothetical protein PBR_0444 [Segatella baroniae B14]UKK79649.1 sirohydrochlorin cobaltochelatase [Segatella baroniae B14]
MILKILHKKKKHKVVLYPLLLIAGNHALQDIQGVWKNALSDTHIGAHGALTQNANLNIHTGWRMDSIGTYCQE